MRNHPDYLSSAVSRALILAGHFAARENRAVISPLHLARALVEGEPEGLAATAAAGHGYRRIHENSRPNPIETGSEVGSWDRLVSSAVRQAHRLTGEVTGEVLLCFLLVGDQEASEFLKSGGLNAAAFRDAILARYAEPIAVVEPLVVPGPTEDSGIARIMDANLNRSREALRVLEDFARFHLDDAGLVRACKRFRHQLREIPTRLGLPPATGRDTPNDVGTAIATASEFDRTDIANVVTANCKRVQESLRSLEEYAKLLDAEVARTLEAMRYESYTLETSLGAVTTGRDRLNGVKLYWLFTGSACRISPERAVSEAVAGGVDMIQLREKSLCDDRLLKQAKLLRAWTRTAGVPLIVNDRPDIARLVDAEGVHLGQDDLPVAAARAILGPKAIIGVSTHDIEQVRQALRDGANYVGVGPTFSSTTKEFAELAGLDFVRAVAAETGIPAFVLGGVNVENVTEVTAAGGKRVAVSAAISTSEHPGNVAQLLAGSLAAS